MPIRVSLFTSLDGIVQAPGHTDEHRADGFGHGGWSMPYFDDSIGAAAGAAMDDVTSLLLGRTTWQIFADTWPDRHDDPFADLLNRMPKHVVTTTLTDPGWNTTVIPGADWRPAIAALRESHTVLIMGSARLTSTLLAAGMIDDLRLIIEPVLLGGGKSLFPDDGNLRGLTLQESTTSSTGAIITRYTTDDAGPAR